MHITVSGSMRFRREMEHLRRDLEARGHVVALPALVPADPERAPLPDHDRVGRKRRFVDEHLQSIRACDALLVANFDTAQHVGYVGPSTLVELAFAYVLGVRSYLLHEPGEQPAETEALAFAPIVLHGDLDLLDEGAEPAA